MVIHRFSPRKLILIGTVLTIIALAGFANMGGALCVYYGFWVVYTLGYILSGPIPHQLIVSHWFRLNRGKAMGIVYVGVGLMGSLGSFLVKPLTEKFGYHVALMVLAGLILLAWPIVLFVMKDKPSDIGQNPDGAAEPPAETKVQSHTFAQLLGSWPFWLLLHRQLLLHRLHRRGQFSHEVCVSGRRLSRKGRSWMAPGARLRC